LGPAGLAEDPNGRLYVSYAESNEIVVYQGERIRDRWNPPLSAPRGISFDPGGRLLVADAGHHRIVVLGTDGKILLTFGAEGSQDGQFRSPSDVLVDPLGNVIVADTFNNRLQIFDLQGNHRKTIGTLGDNPGQFREPAGLALAEDVLYVANGWNGRVDLFRYDAKSLEIQFLRSITGFWVSADVAVGKDGSLYALDRNNGWIGKWDRDGGELRRFDGGNYGLLRQPSALHALRDGRIAVADTGNDRVLLLDPEMTDLLRPRVDRITRNSATILWETRTDLNRQPAFQVIQRPTSHATILNAEGRDADAVRKAETGKRYETTLQNLKPGTGYYFWWTADSIRVLEPAPNRSRVFAFATEPTPGQKTILNLPIAVIVRTDVWNPEGSNGASRGAPPGEAYLRYVEQEFEDARLFYFINSHCRVNLQYEWFVYDLPLTRGEPWPDSANEDALLRERGRERGDYVALVVVDAERRYDPTRKAYYLQGSGGGTWGAHWNGFGEKSDPAHCSFLGGSDLAWLMTHEFHHALDSMFEQSGFEEYPFNHFGDYRVGGYNGPFGEHWDGNAYILRVWPEHAWFYCLFGSVGTTADRDNDGVPDDDASLPFDEKRWGSDPSKISTAGDGITDLQRLMFSHWVPATLDSINNVRCDLIRPDPRKTDQTGLGIPDSQKREPCIPWYEEIPFGSPDLSKSIADEPAWREKRGRFGTEGFEGGAYMTWDETGIYLALSFSNKPAEFQITTDFLGDGFFAGQDNYVLTVDCRGSRATIKSFGVLNGGQNRWPFNDTSLVPVQSLQIESDFQPTWAQVRIKLPWHLKSGLTCREGDVYRFAFTFLVKDGVNQWNGDRIHISAFEPYKMLPMRLVR
jgi:DNA-binding beta-propeller fold protein YncE